MIGLQKKRYDSLIEIKNFAKEFSWKEFYKSTKNKEMIKNIVDFVTRNYKPQEKYVYSDKSGWTVFFRKSGKSLLSLNYSERLTITVVIGRSLNNEVENSKISDATKIMFRNAHQYNDGKWLKFILETKEQIEDIKKLLFIKKKPIRDY